MASGEITKCRVCDDLPLVDWSGLCKACSEATIDFWRTRREQLKKRGVWGSGKTKPA